MSKVTEEDLLRRNMGGRRTEALRGFGDKTGLSLEPDAARLAGWIPMLAKDLERRRKATARDWENFYADLAQRSDVLPFLQGQRVFRNEGRRVVPAEGGTLEDGRSTQFFINAELGGSSRTRKRKRLDDASLFPPSCITKGMEFADPTLAWPADVVSAFVKHGLASEFKLVKVISKIGELLGANVTQWPHGMTRYAREVSKADFDVYETPAVASRRTETSNVRSVAGMVTAKPT